MKTTFFFLLSLSLLYFANCSNHHRKDRNKRDTSNVRKEYLDSTKISIDTAHSATNTKTRNNTGVCDPALWDHVYHKDRLQVVYDCYTVTGTIEKIRKEKDGDDHILLHLDAGQESLLNEKNITEQHGDLVLEPIYVHPPKQADAIACYDGYTNHVMIPSVGDHVSVMGSYVKDTEHGWMEIHPVTSIIVIGNRK